MTLKNEIKSTFSNSKEKIEMRYAGAKIIFIFVIFVFFLNFYLVGAGIGEKFLGKILSPLYFLLILTLNLFIFFLSQKIFFDKKIISYIISLIFILLSIFFILPIIL